ncbi:caspase-1 [Anabrus simplex]|uniref:caspase-1 n=1 Tax=Anabrus simplex TaxID=316456 RepID=UPI0035A369F3
MGSHSKAVLLDSPYFSLKEYNMQHPRRGVALIFNHENFEKDLSLDQRLGTNKDCAELTIALQDLNFEVRVCQDYTHCEITDVLRNVANVADHSNADCLLVAVLTHGSAEGLYARDEYYSSGEIWTPFQADNCPSLAGKPKIFIIQACRGDQEDRGVKIFPDVNGMRTQCMIPTHCDMLIAYSCVLGFTSFRETDEGSWFIQSLIAELRVNGTREDLLTLLTNVNGRVAAITPSSGVKQMPNFTSSLTKIVKFTARNDYYTTSIEQEQMMIDRTAVGMRRYISRTPVYLENLHESTTREQLIQYLNKQGITDIGDCTPLPSKGCKKTFKVYIPLSDLEKTRAPAFWEKGIRVTTLDFPQAYKRTRFN